MFGRGRGRANFGANESSDDSDIEGLAREQRRNAFNAAEFGERGGFGGNARQFNIARPLYNERNAFGQRGRTAEQNNLDRTVNDKTTTVKWNIGNLSTLYKNNNFNKSRSFTLTEESSTQFVLYLNGKKSCDHMDFIGLRMEKPDDAETPLHLNIRFWLENKNGRQIYSVNLPTKKFRYLGEKIALNLRTTNKMTDFLDCVDVDDSRLTIVCQMEKVTPHNDIGVKMYDLCQQGLGHDAIIQADGQEFKISAAVFMAQSAVFKTMFSHIYNEGKERVVIIEDISADAMEAFICWMYTGQLVNELIVEDLYAAADKYFVDELKTRCARTMIDTLTETNAAKRLALASTHSDIGFEDDILRYIATLVPKKIRDVYSSRDWFEYMVTLPYAAEYF